MSITRLDKLLQTRTGDGLGKIIQRAQKLEALTGVLRARLPAEMAQSLVATNLRDDGELVLICATSAWASRMRFETDGLIDAARRAGFMVDRARITVSQQT